MILISNLVLPRSGKIVLNLCSQSELNTIKESKRWRVYWSLKRDSSLNSTAGICIYFSNQQEKMHYVRWDYRNSENTLFYTLSVFWKRVIYDFILCKVNSKGTWKSSTYSTKEKGSVCS